MEPTMFDDLQEYWESLASVARAMPYRLMERAADLLLECHARANTIYIMGNGGSAATASHFACDLAKGTRCELAPPFRVVPLTDNTPLMTAWANDISYERIFAEQLSALVRPHDVVIVISASGNSPNILAAVEVAREAQALSIALTGHTGGALRRLAYLTIPVPSESMEQVEDIHLAIGHSLCVALRRRLRADAELADRQTTTVSEGAIAGEFPRI